MKFKLSTLRKIKYGSLATVITVSFLLVIVLLNVFVQLASHAPVYGPEQREGIWDLEAVCGVPAHS